MTRYEKLRAEGKFPFSFWCYCGLDILGPEAVKDWVDAGITVAQTPGFNPERDKPEQMFAVLDACAEAGIWSIMGYHGVSFGWDPDSQAEEDAFRKRFEKAVKLFGDHPAVLGFHAGDEPNSAKSSLSAFKTYAIQKEMAPHLTPYQNLGPYGPGTTEWVGYDDYDKFMKDCRDIANPEFVCFDVYWQLNPDEGGRDLYFGCLKKYTENTLPYNIPLWYTGCAVGHFKYRCPNEDLFNWQINTAAAHGITGVSWFFMYMRDPHGNYRVPPINEFWERTETYDWMSRANRRFQRMHGWLMPQLKLQNVSHVGKVYGGYPEFTPTPLIKAVSNEQMAIVSEFKDAEGRDYIAAVNNSQSENGWVSLTLNGKPKVVQIGWDKKLNPPRVQSPDPAFPDDLRIGHWLAPGQMEIWRLEKA